MYCVNFGQTLSGLLVVSLVFFKFVIYDQSSQTT